MRARRCRVSVAPLTAKASPLRRAVTWSGVPVVTVPASSSRAPPASLRAASDAERPVAGPVPVLVSASTVTATFSWVMNLRWATRRPPRGVDAGPVARVLARAAVSSVRVAPGTATVKRFCVGPSVPGARGRRIRPRSPAGRAVRVHVERAPPRVEVAVLVARNGRSSTRSNQNELPPTARSASYIVRAWSAQGSTGPGSAGTGPAAGEDRRSRVDWRNPRLIVGLRRLRESQADRHHQRQAPCKC